VECWGWNRFGQLGDGTTVQRTRPTPVRGLADAREIAAGDGHTCALLDAGTVDCWGWNDVGQLGDGTRVDRRLPVPVHGLKGVVAISAGNGDTCALLRSGEIRCWGLNLYGQLGDGTRIDRATPVRVLGLAQGKGVLLVRVLGRGAVTGTAVRCSSQCGYERPRGTKLALTARPRPGWAFGHWYGACKGSARHCSWTAGRTDSLVARFVKRP
jgi:hypothetical protein